MDHLERLRMLCRYCALIVACLLVGCTKRPAAPATSRADDGRSSQKRSADQSLDKQLTDKGPEAVKALELVLKRSEDVPPTTLFLSAHVAFNEKRLEDSAFLYYAAQQRARFDRECFAARGTGGDSPFVLYAALSSQIGSYLNPAIMGDPPVFARALDRVKAWDPKAPKEYDPGYEFTERKTEEAAREANKPRRQEFLEKMAGRSTLLNDPEYFAAFRVYQAHNLSVDDKGPTKEASDKAAEVMMRLEKERGIKGFLSVTQ
jgi:hypothetical protein